MSCTPHPVAGPPVSVDPLGQRPHGTPSQDAACCIANMGNLTVNGVATQASGDGVALHILGPSLEVRHHWNDFTLGGPSPTQGSQGGVDIDVRGTAVALVMTTSGAMVTAGPLAGSGPNLGGAPVGYLVVLPTVPVAAEARGLGSTV